MENDYNQQLEKSIQFELEKLPDLPAPETLIPRVLAALEARARAPIWERSWWNWPRRLQAVSAALAITLVGAILYGGHLLSGRLAVNAGQQSVADWWLGFAWVAEVLGTLGYALLIVGRSIEQHWFVGISALIFIMYLTCIGVGTVCFRVAISKR
ncbi:MAG: hypothetical protein FJ403_01380 [Verrucomicrobia bacterium]|nr:hypothetical protein [Verrucomicrobiota bacterium]